MINFNLIFIGLILIILSYIVGAKKQTWLLNGFNQHRVSDKEKLSKVVGVYNLFAGVVLVVCSFLFPSSGAESSIGIVVPLVALGYILLAIYVNSNLVDK